MRGKAVIVLLLAAVVTAGCSASELQARKENSWSHVPQALPDRYDPNPGGYVHPLRPVAFLLNPIGVALDYALVRPFYLLAGLAPEWFGLTNEDAYSYHEHFPVLIIPRDTPPTFPLGAVDPTRRDGLVGAESP